MSVILRTHAIVLRMHPLTNTSRIVTWLSEDAGHIATVIKGACRPKSRFLGQFDLFQTCELLYYARDRGGLHIARECSTLERRDQFRDDWRAMLCASYICNLIENVAEAAPQGGNLFSLLAESLDLIARLGASRPVLFSFEMRILQAIGLAPALDGCPHCSGENADQLRFAVADGRVVCPQCSRQDGHAAAVRISAQARAAMRSCATSPASRIASSPPQQATLSPGVWEEMRRIIGLFMRYHLDVPLESRAIAWAVFDSP
jgi:DNA repair protein RecO (recombination protein O)